MPTPICTEYVHVGTREGDEVRCTTPALPGDTLCNAHRLAATNRDLDNSSTVIANLDTELAHARDRADRASTSFREQTNRVAEWNHELHYALGIPDDDERSIDQLIDDARTMRDERDNLHAAIERWRRQLTEALQLADAGEPTWSVVNQACEELDAARTDPTPAYPWTAAPRWTPTHPDYTAWLAEGAEGIDSADVDQEASDA